MISRNKTNPMHWDATPSMLPELLPYLVEFVAEEGGEYIITKDGNISVCKVMNRKRLVDRYALGARIQLSLFESASSLEDILDHKNNMEKGAYLAGGYFCLYVCELGRNANPQVPLLISDNPMLKELFDRGFHNQGGYAAPEN